MVDLLGVRVVRYEITLKRRFQLQKELGTLKRAWADATRRCARAGHGHVMDGVDVIVLEHTSYTARCWDDDRIFVNIGRLALHPKPSRVLVHEFAHRVWFHCLTSTQRSAWLGTYAEAKRRGELISDYAATSATEDFAEVFAFRVMDGKDRLPRASRARWERMLDAGR